MPSLVNRRVQLALKGWPASSNLDRGFIPWDVVALMATLRPDSFLAVRRGWRRWRAKCAFRLCVAFWTAFWIACVSGFGSLVRRVLVERNMQSAATKE